MSLFRNIATEEIREIDPDLVVRWEEVNNPKAMLWVPYIAPEPPPTPPSPNYISFYQALLASQSYQQGVLPLVLSGTSPTIVGRLTIFESQFSEARNGRAIPEALQAALWILLEELVPTEAMQEELQGLLEQFNLAALYSLAPPQ